MHRVGLSLHWTGSCRHPQCSTRRDGSLALHDYPMYAAVIERNGELCVFDPGYAPHFIDATEPFPERFYRWLTPARCPPEAALAAQLRERHDAVRHVVLSHFHADHIAGLGDFPNATVYASRAAWDAFRSRSRLHALAGGFLPALAPRDLEARLRLVDELPRRGTDPAFAPFDHGHDLFGDASVLLTPLPGHAHGQLGAMLRCESGPERFLIADASWSIEALERDAPPPWPVMRLLGQPRAYLDTWMRLRELRRRNPAVRLLPAHCSVAAASEGARA